MNSNYCSIDTDAAIGTILSHFSSDYIDHVVEDSLNMKFRPFSTGMPNMVDVLERQFNCIMVNTPDYKEKILETRIETYKEIIMKICNYYNFTFTVDLDTMMPEEVYGIAHIMYDVFISRFTEYMNHFFVMYIVNNADAIAMYLKSDSDSFKPKESGVYNPNLYIEPKFILIHANINKVIYNMTAYDIPLHTLLEYFLDKNNAERLSMFLQDNGDVYKTHYACYILDQRYSAGVLTNIKLQLQSKTLEAKSL